MFRYKISLLFVVCLALAWLGTLSSCAKKKDAIELQDSLRVNNMNISEGTYKTQVEFTGSGFSTTADVNKVYFNGKAAAIESATETKVVASVPDNAGSGEVSITVGKYSVSAGYFQYYYPPVINSLSINSSIYNTPVTIKGSNFHLLKDLNKVYYNGVQATITASSPTQLEVLVPLGAETGKVSVNNSYYTTIGPEFNYVRSIIYTANIEVNRDQSVFRGLGKLVADSKGNVFAADYGHHRIAKVAPNLQISTFAGGIAAGGEVTNTSIFYPNILTIDKNDNLFVLQTNVIRKISPAGVITQADNLKLYKYPIIQFIQADAQDNIYFMSLDPYTQLLKISSNGTPNEVTSTPPANIPAFRNTAIADIITDEQGNIYYSAPLDHVVRKISPSGVISNYAGTGQSGRKNGPISMATFEQPSVMTIDKAGNTYVVDRGSATLRKISNDGIVSTFSIQAKGFTLDPNFGADQFIEPSGIAIDGSGNLYVGIRYNNTIYKLVAELK
jgi:sugar lactone lactonase YvrE